MWYGATYVARRNVGCAFMAHHKGRTPTNPNGRTPSVWAVAECERVREGRCAMNAHPTARPVKHGLVGHPGEWAFSPWHRDGGGAVW
jgi:hypothetical protein